MAALPTPGTSDVWGTQLNNAIKSITTQGLASARPTTGDFAGQVYSATDTGTVSRWNGTTWDVWYQTATATETAPGKVELATAAETATGTDATRAVHPAGLKPLLDGKASTTAVGVSAYKATAQSIPNATYSDITFDTETFDTNGFHDNTTNNARLTVPSGMGGLYQIVGTIIWDSSGAAGRRWAKILLNGTTSLATDYRYTTVADYFGNSVVTIAYLTPGDYVTIQGLQASGGALNVSATTATTFGMFRVGA